MVVEVGLTVVEPEALVEVKLPGVIVMEVAPLVFHAKVEDAPTRMELGEAVNEEMVGSDEEPPPAGTKVIMASAQGPPPELQVSVWVLAGEMGPL